MNKLLIAKNKLQPASYCAIFGGIGLGVSIFLPMFSIWFLISVNIRPIDFGFLVYGSFGVAAILAVWAGYDLNSTFKSDARVQLIISILTLGVGWVIIFLQVRDYYSPTPEEYGEYYNFVLPLQYEIGFYLAIGASALIGIALLILSMNHSVYKIAQEESQKIKWQQRQRMITPPRGVASQVANRHYCIDCGTEHGDYQRFCIKCGKEIYKENS